MKSSLFKSRSASGNSSLDGSGSFKKRTAILMNIEDDKKDSSEMSPPFSPSKVIGASRVGLHRRYNSANKYKNVIMIIMYHLLRRIALMTFVLTTTKITKKMSVTIEGRSCIPN